MRSYPETLPFGKWKGYKIEYVPTQYLRWFSKNVQVTNEPLEYIMNEVLDEIDYRDEMESN